MEKTAIDAVKTTLLTLVVIFALNKFTPTKNLVQRALNGN